jgi:rubrerythrin
MQNLSVNEVIEFALNIERNGRDFYESALGRTNLEEDARKLITKLRDEEIGHEKYFKTLRDSEDLAELVDPDGWEMTSSYLDSIIKAHIFSKEGSSIKLAIEAKDTPEIIKFAMQFEKDTLLYFHTIYAETKEPKAQKAIFSIIKEEMKHLRFLQEMSAKL